MEDAKLVKLHETLKKLQPKGKSGGLGFGGGFGAPKKQEDGLPKNGLYAYFVRAGEGGYKRWDDNEEAEEAEQEEEEASVKKVSKKKDKKKKKKRKVEAEAEAVAEVAAASKPTKRKRAESVGSQNPQEADGEGEAGAFPWEKHIRAALKGAEGQRMCVKKLRKHVVGLAKAHPAAGQQKKKELKLAFHGAVEAHDKLHHDEAAGVVSYKKKGKAKAEAEPEETAVSAKRSKKDKSKGKEEAAAVSEAPARAAEAAAEAKASKKKAKTEKKS